MQDLEAMYLRRNGGREQEGHLRCSIVLLGYTPLPSPWVGGGWGLTIPAALLRVATKTHDLAEFFRESWLSAKNSTKRSFARACAAGLVPFPVAISARRRTQTADRGMRQCELAVAFGTRGQG